MSKVVGQAVLSPMSVIQVMLPLLYGCRGENYTQLLNLFEIDDLRLRRLLVLLEAFQQLNSVKMHSGFFLRDTVKQDFRDHLSKFGRVETVNFSNSTGVQHMINSWVSDRTGGLIPQLIPNGLITPDNVFMLINTIHFKRQWTHPFGDYWYYDADSNVTCPTSSSFTTLSGVQTDVKLMMANEDYDHTETTTHHIVEIPYVDNFYSFGLVLPKVHGSQLMSLIDIGELKFRSTPLKLIMPEFTIRHKTDVKEMLQQLGVIDLFTEGKANLAGIHERTFVDAVLQEVCIKVDKLGTEATVATAVSGKLECYRGPPKEIKADRTFQFYIKNNTRQLILFSGVFDGTNN